MSLRRIGREDVSLSVFEGRCSGSLVAQGKKADLLRASGRRGQQRNALQYAERCSLPFPEPAAAAEGVNLFWWEPTAAAPTRVLLNQEESPLPIVRQYTGRAPVLIALLVCTPLHLASTLCCSFYVA